METETFGPTPALNCNACDCCTRDRAELLCPGTVEMDHAFSQNICGTVFFAPRCSVSRLGPCWPQVPPACSAQRGARGASPRGSSLEAKVGDRAFLSSIRRWPPSNLHRDQILRICCQRKLPCGQTAISTVTSGSPTLGHNFWTRTPFAAGEAKRKKMLLFTLLLLLLRKQ
jgi:hypothetical protein